MGELSQEFLKQTISNLKALQNEFSEEILSDDFLRRFFRALHTIKGASNTFNLFYLAKLAHEIENLVHFVQKEKIPQNNETKSIFRESFVQLLQTAHNYQHKKSVSLSADFVSKLNSIIPEKKDSSDLYIFQIPPRILSRLLINEKDALNLAIQNGKTFYLLKVGFTLQTFYDDFKKFKEILNANGEVIAVSAGTNKNPAEEINFQAFFVSNLNKKAVKKLINNFSVQIEFENVPPSQNLPANLAEVLENLVNYGTKTAHFLNKNIIFETNFSDAQVSTDQLLLLNEVASHLLHNAIDHAVENADERVISGKDPNAKISINLTKVEDTLIFELEDDGSGIEVDKIILVAKEKGLIPSDSKLTEKEALEIIFAQGFSTSKTISEISGRGVGLDAVKDLVEKSGGRIEVKTQNGLGTKFSVYLPKK